MGENTSFLFSTTFDDSFLSNGVQFNSGTSIIINSIKLKEIFSDADPVSRFKIVNQIFTTRESFRLVKDAKTKLKTVFDEGDKINPIVDDLSSILLTEYKTYLCDDILQKVDRATMSASLEGREPFLDHRILEWVAGLPSEYKMKGNEQKILLKAIVHKHIPESIMKRPKMGFGIPLVQWMRKDLRPLFDEIMSDQSIHAVPVLNAQDVMAMRNSYLEGKLENFERLWLVFAFMLWYKRWMA